MDGLMKGLFGGSKSATPPSTADDTDFADFAGAPDPVPAPSFTPLSATPSYDGPTIQTSASLVPYTKWYRVWERTSPKDFYQEAFILPFLCIIVGIHVWGRRKNKSKANAWIAAHAPILEKEFAVVGFGGRRSPTVEDVQESGLAQASESDSLIIPAELLKEKTAQEYTTYATGRQNVAFVDLKLSLFKRYNPLTLVLEWLLSFLFDTIRTPVERMEVTAYAFDGKERDLVPASLPGESDVKGTHSTYDGFVWALVNKDTMRQLREDRYDISLTITKDHPKLPPWASVMSESAEVTDVLLTSELIKAVEEAGDERFEHLVITDQPVDKPQKLHETIPRKRLSLSLLLPRTSSSSPSAYARTLPLFHHFLRLPDTLVQSARFRPEVIRKIRATREDESRKLRKIDEEEKAEERKVEGDKKKKADRDAKLKVLGPEQQRKFLEQERKTETKKQSKKMTKRG